VTIFARDGAAATVQVIHVVSDELRDIQGQVTSQAQAVQAMSNFGFRISDFETALSQIRNSQSAIRNSSQPPSVRVLEELEPTHIERLLETRPEPWRKSGDDDA